MCHVGGGEATLGQLLGLSLFKWMEGFFRAQIIAFWIAGASSYGTCPNEIQLKISSRFFKECGSEELPWWTGNC